MIVAARCDHRHRAIVLDTIGVRMHALVQLRRSAQRERVEESVEMKIATNARPRFIEHANVLMAFASF